MARREKTFTTTKQAMEQATAILRLHVPTIPGARDDGNLERKLADAVEREYLTIEWDRGWGLGCSLSISIRHSRIEREDIRVVHHRLARVEVGWSSTGRTPGDAIARSRSTGRSRSSRASSRRVLGRLEIAEVTTVTAK